MTQKTYAIQVNPNGKTFMMLQSPSGDIKHYPTIKLAQLHIKSLTAISGSYESDCEYSIINATDATDATDDKLWICGEIESPENHLQWEVAGVFTDKNEAIKACITENHFIGSILINKSYNGNYGTFKDSYYPLLKQ